MFARKLAALNYVSPNEFDYSNETIYREFIVWIENRKIRNYKIDDRKALDDVTSDTWNNALTNYLKDLNYPFDLKNRELIIEWLLTTAVRLEYSDNNSKFNINRLKITNQNEKEESNNALDNLDYSSDEFKDGVKKLQKLLEVTNKPDDYTSIFKAISKLIEQRLSQTSVIPHDKSAQLSLETMSVGLESSDDCTLNEATKILRLLHIKELRNFQTKINETIVELQAISANPKTDSSLGKVGS